VRLLVFVCPQGLAVVRVGRRCGDRVPRVSVGERELSQRTVPHRSRRQPSGLPRLRAGLATGKERRRSRRRTLTRIRHRARHEFVFNPTSCAPLDIQTTMSSTGGATVTDATPFQVTNCAVLAFKPQFKAYTSAHTSRANGASLHVKLSFPNTPLGSRTNVAQVKVDLPKKLPSRLTTLQKACPAQTFEANPASCSTASRVGSFQLYLPQGKDSALAANGNLCQATLKMPTAFTAQDGTNIHTTTPVNVTGCKTKTRAAKRALASRRRSRRGLATAIPSASGGQANGRSK
jgi:hypothetical protein